MSILKKFVYSICMASVLCACPFTASAVEVSDAEMGSVTATVNATTETDTTAAEEPSTSTTSAKFSIGNASGNVGENVDITITADADTAFASATFVLHYDSSKLKYIDYSIPSNSGLNSDNLTRVEDKDSGVVYLVLAETEEDIKNANITMTFEILNAGDSQVSLEISDMFTTDGTEVSILDVQATGTITGVEKETEPPVTTTTEFSDTETTTTTTSSNIDDLDETTTKLDSDSTSNNLTETSTTSTTSLSETTTTVTDTSTNNDSTTTNTNKNTTVSTKNTLSSTSKTTTTTAKLNNSSEKKEESAQTGDSFPFLPLVVAIGGSATLAFVTRKKKAE